MEEKALSLSDMKKKKPEYEQVDMTKVRAIAENSKREEARKVSKEENEKKEKEVMDKVDNRLNSLKEENKLFNKLKYEEIERRKREESGLLDSEDDDDLKIPIDIIDEGEDDMVDDKLIIYNDEDNVQIKDEKKESKEQEHNDLSFDLEESDDKLVIYDENENSNGNVKEIIDSIPNAMNKVDNKIESIKEENELFNKLKHEEIERRKREESATDKVEETSKSKVLIVDGKNDHTIMKSGVNLSEDDAKSNTVFDDKDFEDIDKKVVEDDTKEYIEMDDTENSEEDDPNAIKDFDFTTAQLDKFFEEMREELKGLLKPVKNVIDISKFKIGSPINVNNAKSTRHKDICEHVLWNAKRTFAMEELEGFEVNELAAPLEEGSEYSQTIRKFTILFDHIRSKKPIDVITWLKNLRDDDLDHVYMGGYMSSFKDANILASQCEHCKFPYISKYIPMKNMMKFETPEVETKYQDLLNNPDDSPYSISGKGYQISDDYLFKLKAPSVWKTKIEPLLLEPEFRKKYRSIINILTYVDVIYKIDRDTYELRPIDFSSDIAKDEKNRSRKVLKNKIRKYGLIISKELNVDQFQKLWSYIYKEANVTERGLTYRLPERKCPKCNSTDIEYPMNAEDLLFTRHQLVQLGSI